MDYNWRVIPEVNGGDLGIINPFVLKIRFVYSSSLFIHLISIGEFGESTNLSRNEIRKCEIKQNKWMSTDIF